MNENITSIGVSKGLQEFNLKPGEEISGDFDVINLGDSPLRFQIRVAPYSVENGSYSANFTDFDAFNYIKDWVSLEEPDGELLPKERKTINYKISVPEDAPAGGQYSAFIVEVLKGEDKKEGLSLSVNGQVASLLYASVAGETRADGDILENNISILFIDKPIEASSLIENNGNIHSKAKYVLKVYPLFSNEELYSTEEKPEENILLPETDLYSRKTWEETPRLGFFRVSQEISFAEETSKTEKIVFVSPSWFLILTSLFILSMIFWLVLRIRERKQRIKLS